MSAKASLAYQQVGNAISVPHALLVLLSALDSIMKANCNLRKAIYECWLDRVSSFNSVVIADGQFVVICKKAHVLSAMKIVPPEVTTPDYVTWKIVSIANGSAIDVSFPPTWSAKDACSIFTWKHDISRHVFLRHEDFPNIMQFTLPDLASIVCECQVCLDGHPFAEVSMKNCAVPLDSDIHAFVSRVLSSLPKVFEAPSSTVLRCISQSDHRCAVTKVPKAWTLQQIVDQVFVPSAAGAPIVLSPKSQCSVSKSTNAATMFGLSCVWVVSHNMTPAFDLSGDDVCDLISPTMPFPIALPRDGVLEQPVQLGFDQIVTSHFFRQAMFVSETHLAVRDDCIPTWFAVDVPSMVFSLPIRKRQLVHDDEVHIPLIAKRPRHHCIAPDQAIVGFLLPQRPANQPWVVGRTGSRSFCALVVQHPENSLIVQFEGQQYLISKINGRRPNANFDGLRHADILDLALQGPVHAGGHHHAGPQSLPSGASFEARCEFSVNTSGWLAQDELVFFTQQIQWVNPDFGFFTPVVKWDRELESFDEDSYGEISVPNNRLTIIPVLAGSHWAAIEINRVSHQVQVGAVGFPGPFLPRVAAAIARVLDLTPDMLHCEAIALPDLPHMCGWLLLRRWITLSQMSDMLPPAEDGFGTLPIDKQQLVNDVITSAIEDWMRADIHLDDWLVPSKLRRAFFVHLAQNSQFGEPVTNLRLFVHFQDSDDPPPDRVSPLSLIHPAMPEFHVLGRLLHIRDHPGWLASDELDFLLDLLRRLFFDELLCPPCWWDSRRRVLVYFGGLMPDFRFHQKVTWFCIIDSTWVQVDMRLTAEDVRFFFCAAPPPLFAAAELIVQAIMNSLGLARGTCQTVMIPFLAPENFCGWSLIHGLYVRRDLRLPDSTIPMLAILRASRHHVVLNELNTAAIDQWERSEADIASFGDFAKKIQGPFEVVLHDPSLHADYKRLVLVLALHGKISFQLPKPTIALTTTEVVEIVAEVDSRVLSAHELEAVKAAPLEFIRGNIWQLHPDFKDSLSFYALRTGRHPAASKADIQWQCILKAPQAHRKALLKSSRMLPVMLRDFLDKSPAKKDHTVVPRFWTPSARELGGRFFDPASSWQGPHPDKKAFRAGGVHGWVIAFQEKPSILRFTLEINKETFEILLVEDELVPFNKASSRAANAGRKNKKKEEATNDQNLPQAEPTRGSSNAASTHFAFDPQRTLDSQSLKTLEEKFDRLETRHDRIEKKSLFASFRPRHMDLVLLLSSVQSFLQSSSVPAGLVDFYS
ncbi:unnamed protein product [Durusdinium trenchii]|uniref:Ubiquitin-like protease family profile domain-containing protein n=1 Tax=Durusdinium trenchii TaxID=1381693 RepID=A0ABP0RWR6_9DINO